MEKIKTGSEIENRKVVSQKEWLAARLDSTYERGVDGLWGMYQWLDRAPLGRNEKGLWFRRHDEYGREFPSNGPAKDCCE
jgi:predicted dithiol-disulfide oxidoreductase (DUF899 family)